MARLLWRKRRGKDGRVCVGENREWIQVVVAPMRDGTEADRSGEIFLAVRSLLLTALSRARQAHLAVVDVVELAIGVVTGRRAVWVLHTNASWPRRVDLAVPLSSQRSSRKR